MVYHSVQGTHQQRRCGGQGRRPMAASINTSLFASSNKITPRPPPSPMLRSASFTTNVLVVPCVAAHTRQRQAVCALRGSVCREALASDALRFTRTSCQAAFDASNTTLTLLGLEDDDPFIVLTEKKFIGSCPCAHSAALRTRWRRRSTICLRSCTWQTRARFASCCTVTGRSGSSRSWVPSCTRACATSRRCWQLLAGGERDGRRRGRAPRRRAPGARRDAAAAPARGARAGAPARARAATFNLELKVASR